MPPTRRETEDEGVKEYLLELAAKEAERQIQEDALAVFPNSRAREGGVAHFYFREGSSSEESPDDASRDEERGRRRVRRRSSSMDLNWWQRHVRQHAEQLAERRAMVEEASTAERPPDAAGESQDIDMTSDSELDKMDLSAPPDPMWTTSTRMAPDDGRDSMAKQAEALRLAAAGVQHKEDRPPAGPHALPGPARDSGLDRSKAPASQLPQDPGSRSQQDPFGRPFASLGLKPDAAHLQRLRKLNSPPMLGKELQFRKCPSPKHTRLETDHPFPRQQNAKKHENRDMSGQGGLWRGFCCRSETTGGYLVPAELHPPDMMATPRTPGTPREAFAHEIDNVSICEEPPSLWGSSPPGSSGPGNTMRPVNAEHRQRSGEPKGIHMLHGLDERLQQEKARAERNEKIAQEFDDGFVTQVYNYLSLGYPAMAHSFDEELSRISRVTVDELVKDDAAQIAKGHMLEMKLDETSEEQRCPRWKALRVYITEWARQHPDLDNLNPLAWGMHERRGSWAV